MTTWGAGAGDTGAGTGAGGVGAGVKSCVNGDTSVGVDACVEMTIWGACAGDTGAGTGAGGVGAGVTGATSIAGLGATVLGMSRSANSPVAGTATVTSTTPWPTS